MREALAVLDSAHRDVITKAGQVTIPDCEECNVFHQAFNKYLDNSSEIIAKYDEIVNYIESHNPGTEVDVDDIDLLLNPLLEKDNELFASVTAAQDAMAKKFKFDLE
jgi:tRNA/tmRNA/rRNA uracil-C5-methylase (TrmA/RlmC/RlmD family)